MPIIKKSEVKKIYKRSSSQLKQYKVGVVGLGDNEVKGLGWNTAKLLANSGIGKVCVFLQNIFTLCHKSQSPHEVL